MTDIIALSQHPIPLPAPRVPITIRPATLADLPFIDGLQKKHTKQVGWFPTQTIEGKIKLGHVLVAEEKDEGGRMKEEANANSSLIPHPSSLRPVGYLIGNDQYFKHDDIGIIYQLNVVPGNQRALVGATLLKAQFDRSAYGCRLYCCWCAQDIAANYFWEAMGFVPLAFRAGSAKKSRVHIFWQKRIRAGDETTPYWFPSQTGGGSIREDRIVLPIPPGTHWSDAKPLILPSAELTTPQPTTHNRISKPKAKIQIEKAPALPTLAGLQFSIPTQSKQKPRPEKKKAAKNDPTLVAAARELRDRWLEKVNDTPMLEARGKYDLSRSLDARYAPIAALPAA